MFCSNCGTQIDDTTRFCPTCGQPTAPVQPAAPVQPVAPVAPVEPVVEQPIAPVVPVEPVAPVVPVEPVAPVAEQPVYQPPMPVAEQPVYQQPEGPMPEQPMYGQPMYGQPYYQQPAPAPKKGGKAWIIIVAIIAVLAVIGVCLWLFVLSDDDDDNSKTPSNSLGDILDNNDLPDGWDDDWNTDLGDLPSVDDSTPTDEIVGTWRLEIGVMDAVNMMSGSVTNSNTMLGAMANISSDASMPMIFDVKSDGTYTAYITGNDYVGAMRDFVDDFLDYLRDGGIYDFMQSVQGLSKAQVDASLKQQGMTIDDMVDMLEGQYDTALNDGSLLSVLEQGAGKPDAAGRYVAEIGTYTFDGEYLRMSQNGAPAVYTEFRYDDGEFVLSDASSGKGINMSDAIGNWAMTKD